LSGESITSFIVEKPNVSHFATYEEYCFLLASDSLAFLKQSAILNECEIIIRVKFCAKNLRMRFLQ